MKKVLIYSPTVSLIIDSLEGSEELWRSELFLDWEICLLLSTAEFSSLPSGIRSAHDDPLVAKRGILSNILYLSNHYSQVHIFWYISLLLI